MGTPHGSGKAVAAVLPAVLILGVALVVRAQTTRSSDPLRTQMLIFRDEHGQLRPVTTSEQWQQRRRGIIDAMCEVMGKPPVRWAKLPLEMETLQTERLARYTRSKIRFRVEPEDSLNAWLLVPHDIKGRIPAILCLHQTTPAGKDSPAGLDGNPELFYAHELAERGYVTLVPDYWTFGEYRQSTYDPYKHGYQSGTMKGIWNHMRSINLLQSLPQVDAQRIGCIGHSLGGHNALWLAAIDPRVKAVVTSCGFSSFRSYAASKYGGGDLHNYAQLRYMPRIAAAYGNDSSRMPFEFAEVLAAIAPRPIFINAPLKDENFLIDGVKECIDAARPVYRWMKAEDALRSIHPDAAHAFPAEARRAAYQFLDEWLKSGKPESSSNLVE